MSAMDRELGTFFLQQYQPLETKKDRGLLTALRRKHWITLADVHSSEINWHTFKAQVLFTAKQMS